MDVRDPPIWSDPGRGQSPPTIGVDGHPFASVTLDVGLDLVSQCF